MALIATLHGLCAVCNRFGRIGQDRSPAGFLAGVGRTLVGMTSRFAPGRFDALGVPPRLLKRGLSVMVPVGALAASVNGSPSIVAYAITVGPASEDDAAVMTDPSSTWWFDVYVSPGAPLRQMYRVDELLGVPALGLTMPGLPPVTVEVIPQT